MPLRCALYAGLLLCGVTGFAQLRQDLNLDLRKRTRVLRNFYSGQKLKFDSSGAMVSGGTLGYGPLDGSVYIEDVQLEGSRLVLHGERPLAVLNAITGDITLLGLHEKVEVSIQLPSDKPTYEVADALLDKVFLTQTEVTAAACSSEEADIFRRQMLQSKEFVSATKTAPKTSKEIRELCFPGGARASVVRTGIEPPRPLKTPDPPYPVTKLNQRANHTVVLAIIVDGNGKPSSFVVIGPATIFDVAAIEAVRGWKFRPASDHGRPIAVAINVEVNFRAN